jgi:Cu(I)/Ag(I) efflux system membrane fusion protein
MNTSMTMKIKYFALALLAAAGLCSNPLIRAADGSALAAPVKIVLTNYMAIQAALSADSLKGIPESAGAIVKAVKADQAKLLSADVAQQAEDISQAKDLAAARDAFKSLSDSLIKYLADHQVNSQTYDEVYCPMQNASWLQTDTDVKNPYLGKSMLQCGIVKRTF